MEGWLNSPGHRKNLVQPHMTEIGVGIAKAADKDPKFITVQLFARPQALQYDFQISNASKVKVRYSFGGETHEVDPSHAITHEACAPSALSFEAAGEKKLGATFEAAGGMVYTLQPDKAGVKVDVSRKETILP